MKSNVSRPLIDNYFGLLSSLSKENKIRLIAKLSNSIVDDTTEGENVIDKYFGAFKSDRSADDIISEIKESRTFYRKIESL